MDLASMFQIASDIDIDQMPPKIASSSKPKQMKVKQE